MTEPVKPKFETCITTQEAFSGVFLKVQQDTVQLPDGGTAMREYIRHPGAVAIHACIGYADEKIEYYLATDLTAGDNQLDEGEYIELLEMTPEETFANVMNGNITDSKSITGLFWLRELILRGEI